MPGSWYTGNRLFRPPAYESYWRRRDALAWRDRREGWRKRRDESAQGFATAWKGGATGAEFHEHEAEPGAFLRTR